MNRVNIQSKPSGYKDPNLCIWYISYDGIHMMWTEPNVYVVKSEQCGIFFLHLVGAAWTVMKIIQLDSEDKRCKYNLPLESNGKVITQSQKMALLYSHEFFSRQTAQIA